MNNLYYHMGNFVTGIRNFEFFSFCDNTQKVVVEDVNSVKEIAINVIEASKGDSKPKELSINGDQQESEILETKVEKKEKKEKKKDKTKTDKTDKEEKPKELIYDTVQIDQLIKRIEKLEKQVQDKKKDKTEKTDKQEKSKEVIIDVKEDEKSFTKKDKKELKKLQKKEGLTDAEEIRLKELIQKRDSGPTMTGRELANRIAAGGCLAIISGVLLNYTGYNPLTNQLLNMAIKSGTIISKMDEVRPTLDTLKKCGLKYFLVGAGIGCAAGIDILQGRIPFLQLGYGQAGATVGVAYLNKDYTVWTKGPKNKKDDDE